eukprot:3994995-Karenia_brevis.AAC.1
MDLWGRDLEYNHMQHLSAHPSDGLPLMSACVWADLHLQCTIPEARPEILPISRACIGMPCVFLLANHPNQ